MKKAALKWLAFDPDNHQFGFLLIVIGCVIFVLPLIALAIVRSSSPLKASAQVVGEQTSIAPIVPLPPCGNECSTLNVTWNRPVARVEFTDEAGNTAKCSSSLLTCNAINSKFIPNSNVNYKVKVRNTNGAVLKTGTAVVSEKKYVTADWNWTYAVAVFPSSYADCLVAGANGECHTKSISNNDSRNTVTYNDVKGATIYSIYVCSPNCGEGTATLKTKRRTPPTPSCTLSTDSVTAGKTLRVKSIGDLSGSVGIQGAFLQDVINVGTIRANGSVLITIPQATQPGLYVVRVGEKNIGCKPDLAVQAPESTAQTASSLPAYCEYDFNLDKAVNESDVEMILVYYGENVTTSSSRFDLDKNGNIDLNDALIASKQFGAC